MILKKIMEGADETMKAKFLTVLVWVNLPVNGNLDSTDRIMNSLNLQLEAGGYKDLTMPLLLNFIYASTYPSSL